MRPLAARDLLALWERGTSRHALDRSALLCAWARPDIPVDSISDLALGEVTASVLSLREALFGERIRAHVDCGQCGERLALSISIPDLLMPNAATTGSGFEVAGVRYRLLCLRDLASVAQERDPARAAELLLARCRIDTDGSLITVSDAAFTEIEQALEAADPIADLAFTLCCEVCGHSQAAQLDAAALLWEEIDVQAQVLLREVHQLASAYGWKEDDILGLGAVRRAQYLSMVSA